MGLARWAVAGAAGYAIYNYASRRAARRAGNYNGVSALFGTRQQADLAIEHLVQEHGIDRAAIFVEPAADENSVGLEASGGDAAATNRGHGQRRDAPLHGALRLTAAVTNSQGPAMRRTLEEAGAMAVEAF